MVPTSHQIISRWRLIVVSVQALRSRKDRRAGITPGLDDLRRRFPSMRNKSTRGKNNCPTDRSINAYQGDKGNITGELSPQETTRGCPGPRPSPVEYRSGPCKTVSDAHTDACVCVYEPPKANSHETTNSRKSHDVSVCGAACTHYDCMNQCSSSSDCMLHKAQTHTWDDTCSMRACFNSGGAS